MFQLLLACGGDPTLQSFLVQLHEAPTCQTVHESATSPTETLVGDTGQIIRLQQETASLHAGQTSPWIFCGWPAPCSNPLSVVGNGGLVNSLSRSPGWANGSRHPLRFLSFRNGTRLECTKNVLLSSVGRRLCFSPQCRERWDGCGKSWGSPLRFRDLCLRASSSDRTSVFRFRPAPDCAALDCQQSR